MEPVGAEARCVGESLFGLVGGSGDRRKGSLSLGAGCVKLVGRGRLEITVARFPQTAEWQRLHQLKEDDRRPGLLPQVPYRSSERHLPRSKASKTWGELEL
jgi:hypothetical protein